MTDKQIDDGGTAFPTVDANTREGDYGTAGMSLRDYFAAKAMQGMVCPEQPQNVTTIVKAAYEIADAMIAARKMK